MIKRNLLLLIVPLVFGPLLAFAVPSWVNAHSRDVRTGVQNVRNSGYLAFQAGGPGASNDLYTIRAANGITVHYVAKTGDGSNPTLGWSTAYTRVQDALGAALSGDEIWVAQGVYTPGETVSDSFNLAPGVSVYGGFDTADVQLSDRDWETNVTALSGDIDGNDTTGPNGVVTHTDNITGTNSYHVVWGDGTGGTVITGSTKLDGFTITAGYASGSAPFDHGGGGFYCKGSGGGNNCSPSLKNLVFSGNLAEDGGALYNMAQSSGISSPYISDVDFFGNTANKKGGAMFNNGVSGGDASPGLTKVNFTGNSADTGGAIYNFGSISGSSSPSLTRVIFSDNTAGFTGGGMSNEGSYSGSSSPSLNQVQFIGNLAGVWGGALYNLGFSSGTSSPIMTNVLFSGNFSDQLGGAIYNKGDTNGTSSPTLIHVTISGNWADDPGGAMFNEGIRGGTSEPQVINSILWDNYDPEGITGIRNITATVTLTHSLVQGSGGSDSWILDASLNDGGGNIDSDPLFLAPVAPGDAPNTTGNLRLASGSPAIDKGSNLLSVTVPTDLDGYARPQDGDGDGISTVDMGAYESPTVYKLTVNSTGMGGGVINSAPAWISCGNVCEVILADGALITLIAEADIDSQFDGWGGACISAGTGACALTMDSAKSVTANFSLTQHKLSVSLTGDGDGKVTSQPAGIDCGGDCSQDFDYNQQVSLTAAADPGSTFTGWGGACSGSGTCEVSMTAAKTVNAEFTAAGFEVYLPVEFK